MEEKLKKNWKNNINLFIEESQNKENVGVFIRETCLDLENTDCKKVPDRFNGIDVLEIKAYVLTWGSRNVRDRGGDYIDKEAFRPLPKQLPMLIDHETSVESQVGVWTSFKSDDHGLLANGYVIKDGNEKLVNLLKTKALETVSIGGVWEYDDDSMIKRGRLFETSLVTIPMNPKAKITYVEKSVEENGPKIKSEENPSESLSSMAKDVEPEPKKMSNRERANALYISRIKESKNG